MDGFVEKLIERLEENIFVAELHGFGWNGQRVENLLCLGDVRDIAEQLAEEYKHCIKSSCSNCEVYDKEKHYCPKWCDVIKGTVAEIEENYNTSTEHINCSTDTSTDLISRSAVIEKLNGIYLNNPWDDKEDILEKAIGVVDHFPSFDNNGWIPCSERLPKMGEYVVCSVNDKYADHNIIISRYGGEAYWHDGRIAAWQPLPAPYVQK